MTDQIHSIVQAAEIVAAGEGTPQERLAQGFKAFRRATVASSEWPVELWEKYDCICDRLLAGGTWQKTIDRMDPQTAGECTAHVSKAMKAFAAAVEGVRNHAALSHGAVASARDLNLLESSEGASWDTRCRTKTAPTA